MQHQDFLELLVNDNDGKFYVVKEPVSPTVWEAFVSMERELQQESKLTHSALDAVEILMFGNIKTR